MEILTTENTTPCATFTGPHSKAFRTMAGKNDENGMRNEVRRQNFHMITNKNNGCIMMHATCNLFQVV